jgi:membrane dipeptidase
VSPAAKELLRDTITVDAHSHGHGLTVGSEVDNTIGTSMKDGMLSAVCLTYAADHSVIGRSAAGVLEMKRTPAPGELYKDHLERLDWMDRMAANHGLRRVTSIAQLKDAKAKGEPAMIQDVEGCDFLEGNLERLDEAFRRGVRIVQLVHYVVNDVGDFQTGPIVHNGLTGFGASVIRKLNSVGVLVDVAHGTEQLVRAAAKVATKPLLLSHTALEGSKAMNEKRLAGRRVSPDHARMIADTGGVVGLWHFFNDAPRYVQGIKEMVDVIGVDHVCIGTDQQRPSPDVAMQDYAIFGSLADEMLKGGFTVDETAKILGGNFVRVFEQA